MKKFLTILALLAFASIVNAQGGPGPQVQKGSLAGPVFVASLPASHNSNILYDVRDAASATDCTAGGGTTRVVCKWNGSAYAVVGGAAGTVTTSGSPASPQLARFSSATAITSATATDVSRPLLCTDAGGSDAYTCTPAPAIASYTSGTSFIFRPNTSNTGAATVNVNGLGIKVIQKFVGAGASDLDDNDLRAGGRYTLVYDGTEFLVTSALGNAGMGGSGTVNTVAKFTPDGTHVGDSQITDDGTDVRVTVGTGELSASFQEGNPAAPGRNPGDPGTNLLTLGNYKWKIVFVTASGHTAAGSESTVLAVNPATQFPPVVGLPFGSNLVTAREIYRTAAGGSVFKFVATVADNTTVEYEDNIPDASLGSTAPITNTTAETPKLAIGPSEARLGRIEDEGDTGNIYLDSGLHYFLAGDVNGIGNGTRIDLEDSGGSLSMTANIVHLGGNDTFADVYQTGNGTITLQTAGGESLAIDGTAHTAGIVAATGISNAAPLWGTGTTGVEFQNSGAGLTTKYNNIATAGNGLSAIYGSVSLTTQAASISTTNIQVGGAIALSGLYRLTYYLWITTAGTSGTVSATFGWSDTAAARTASTGNATFGSLAAPLSGSIVIQANGATHITYLTTVTAAVGSPQYALRITLERLQ